MKDLYSFQISVTSPCKEDWNKMSIQTTGKHCAACDQLVTDFTSMNNDEIKEFFKSGTSACGRFYKDQLKQIFTVYTPYKYKRFHWPSIAALIAAGFFSITSVSSQTTIQQPTIQQPTSETNKPVNNDNRDSILVIKGKIVEANTNLPVAFASVMFDGNKGCTTDTTGTFQLNISVNEIKNSLTLTVLSIGYEKKIFTIGKKDINNPLVIELAVREIIMGASVIILKPHVVDKTYLNEYYKHEFFGSNWYSGGWKE